MSLTLAPHVHGVTVDDDLVLLSIVDDTYFCLPAIAGLRIEPDGRVLGAPEMLASGLVDAGLAESTPHSSIVRTGAMPVRRTCRRLLEDAGARDAQPTLRRWRALARAVIAARAGQRCPFAQLVAGPAAKAQALTPEFLADVAAYRRIVPWLPIDGACLFRSHMLRTYLRALGHDAAWVFGVSVWPFRAHCWLQVEDVVLDDEAERLSAYRPILVA